MYADCWLHNSGWQWQKPACHQHFLLPLTLIFCLHIDSVIVPGKISRTALRPTTIHCDGAHQASHIPHSVGGIPLILMYSVASHLQWSIWCIIDWHSAERAHLKPNQPRGIWNRGFGWVRFYTKTAVSVSVTVTITTVLDCFYCVHYVCSCHYYSYSYYYYYAQ